MVPGALIVVPSAIATTCSDVSLSFSGTLTATNQEEEFGFESIDFTSHAASIGSASCAIVTLDAVLSSEDPNSDLDLYVLWEDLDVGSSINPTSDDFVNLTDAYYGSYEFQVAPLRARNTPYTLDVVADLEPAIATSGSNATKPFAVVAIVDTGINPYHQEFRASGYPDGSVNLSVHPSSYIEDYPPGASTLNLSLGASSLSDALTADASLWEGVNEETLYWIPGTKIIGAFDGGGGLESLPYNIFDEHGHGTGTAGLAGGNTLGSCPRCLIVAVEGIDGFKWALSQPWIDFVSNSWSTGGVGAPSLGKLRVQPSIWTRGASARGQTVLFAAGNGFENGFITTEPTLQSWHSGPEWIMTVGAGWRHEDGNNPYCNCSEDESIILAGGKPVDVISYSLGSIPAPDNGSITGTINFSGTSAATPIVAGVLGDVLRHARSKLGDFVEGNRGGVVATGTGSGASYLSDGTLTKTELELVVKHTAQHTRSTWIGILPVSPPTSFVPSEALWAQWSIEGWGIVLPRTGTDAKAVLDGTIALPSRPMDASMSGFDKQVRDALWGPAS